MSQPRHLAVTDLLLHNPGASAADDNVAAAIVPFNGHIVNVYKDQDGVGPIGADEIIDIHKNGVTIFDAAGKITTAAGGTVRTYSALASGAGSVNKGDRLTMDIDQGGTTPGEGVSVAIRISRFNNGSVRNDAPSLLV